MELSQLKDLLMSHAEAVSNLADRLGVDGTELTSDDKQLMRSAMMPAIRECTDLICSSFAIGSKTWLDRNMKDLHRYIDEAM
jgi:hypothetical protein